MTRTLGANDVAGLDAVHGRPEVDEEGPYAHRNPVHGVESRLPLRFPG